MPNQSKEENMEPLFVFDSVVAHLISNSSRTPTDDMIDEVIELLIANIQSNKDYSKTADYLHNIIGAAINEGFTKGFKTGVQFMTVAISQ